VHWHVAAERMSAGGLNNFVINNVINNPIMLSSEMEVVQPLGACSVFFSQSHTENWF
jgi:hypothetical protein